MLSLMTEWRKNALESRDDPQAMRVPSLVTYGSITGDVQMQGNMGVIFSDFGVAQQALRSVAQQAIRWV